MKINSILNSSHSVLYHSMHSINIRIGTVHLLTYESVEHLYQGHIGTN